MKRISIKGLFTLILLNHQGFSLESNSRDDDFPHLGADISSEISFEDQPLFFHTPLHEITIHRIDTDYRKAQFQRQLWGQSYDEIQKTHDKHKDNEEKSSTISLTHSSATDYEADVENFYKQAIIPVILILGSIYVSNLF